MSKLSFRARALDASKPLPIYHARDVPDISDYQAINRTVPQMPTGMEKEEETERHLQEVILAQQTNCHHSVLIPTPEVETDVPHYHQVYQELPRRPSPYIRVPGLGLEEEEPDYDLDSEDEEWLNAQTKERPLSPLHFERMMDKLERGSGNTVLSVRDAQSLLRDEEDLVIAVYDYWLAKRLRLGRALIPAVKNERRDGTSSNNPYLAFRKRMEKMQTRKNRKNDETAYMQMLKLKRDLMKAKNLAEFVMERENKKHQVARVEADIFRRRYQLEDWSGSVMASLRPVSTASSSSSVHRTVSSMGDGWEGKGLTKVEGDDHVHIVGRQPVLLSGLKRKSKKKKFYFPLGTPEPESVMPPSTDKPVKDVLQTTAIEKADEEELDGIFTFRRRPHIRYHKVISDEDEVDWDIARRVPHSRRSTWKRYRYSQTAFGGCYIGQARRRVGRGGRVLWDRECGGSGSEGEEDENREELTTAAGTRDSDLLGPTMKRCRYVSRSPSPTSNFEFQTFPLIETTDPASLPTDPVTSMAIFEFGGFTSDSEFPEDASSFSTLPTSQFALKPSTSDVECDNFPQSQDEHMDTSSPPPSNQLDQTGNSQMGQSNFRMGLTGNAIPSDKHFKKNNVFISGEPSHSNFEPQKFALKPPPTEHIRRQQTPQSQNSHEPPTPNFPRTPVVVPPSTVAPPTMTSSPASLSSVQKRAPVAIPDQPGTATAVATPTQSSSQQTSDVTAALRASGVPLKQPNARVATPGLVDPRLKNRSNHEQRNTAVDGAVRQNLSSQHLTTGTPPNDIGASEPNSASLNLKSDGGRTSAPNGLTQPLKPLAGNPTPSLSPPSSQTSWLMDGPSSSILLLSSKTASNKQPKSSSEGDREVAGASVTSAASVVTSQFLQRQSGSEDTTGGRIGDQIQTARGVSLGLTREIPLPLVQGTVPMTSSRLPTSLSPAPLTPKLESPPPQQMFDKRSMVSGQGLVTRRASATANGSTYPELLQHTARRFSENTERGLKQALAGINHNSLLESATNTLVQPRAKPSEVS